MRIAYVAPYHGPKMVDRRPVVRNRSMSGNLKIELIASLLRARNHDVEIISQGEVIEHALTFYPAFTEPIPGGGITAHYASVLPVRRINGAWSEVKTLGVFKARHRLAPYDAVLIYNLKAPQLTCADYAIRRLNIPVVLEYEDDRLVNVQGKAMQGMGVQRDIHRARRLFQSVAGCIPVSPHLRSQLPPEIPALLLRGVVGSDLLDASRLERPRKKMALFSGTHIASNGVGELIDGWRLAALPDWELHITGSGALTDSLRERARDVPSIVFRGMVSRPELIGLMCSASICLNPHQVSLTPGNVFAFKIMEYLAAGAHVMTTPMGALEPELEAGMTYMTDNTPACIAASLRDVIGAERYRRTARNAAHHSYGPDAVSRSLDELFQRVQHAKRSA
ncbi:MAG TPA: glycosyltransferase [Vicinamibacterales bacterium]|jgi:glycosyltransferase involved in cell wall biosynthesis